MKKHLKTLAAILALAVLLILPFTMGGCAPADDGGSTAGTTTAPTTTAALAHEHCVCGGTEADDACDHASVEWTAWDGTNIKEAGTYNLYLTADLDNDKQINIGDTEGTAEITVNLCLNGYNWSSEKRAVGIMPNVTLNISNCQHASGEATVTGQGDTLANVGGTVMIEAGGTLNMYKGVNLASDNTEGRMQLGGTVQITGTMNMYGGTVTGCEVERQLKEDGSPDTATGQGGAIRVSTDAVFNMYDGTVTGGTACTGGNLRCEGGSTVNMYGGTITGGSAKGLAHSGGISGGNGAGVFLEGCVMNMYGGTITGNYADTKGAGVILNGSGTLNMSGGSITGNTCAHANNGAGLHVNANGTTLNVSGSAQITGNTNASGDSNACLREGWLINIGGELTADAKIGVAILTVEYVDGTFTDLAAPAEAFFSDVDTYTVQANEDGTLKLAE